ncbi:hypothetical protein IKR20_00150 [bacterium]|nr:hypothetical protein [bacterium]
MPKLTKFVRSNSIFRVILILTICGSVYCLNQDFQDSRLSFSFQTADQIKKEVIEDGKINYKDGRSITLKNSYNSLESRNVSDDKIILKGTVNGRIDEALKPFIGGSSYTSEIDLGDTKIDDFNPLYPVALRKLLYFMPKTELFDQKKWVIKAAGSEFPCSYTLSFSESSPSVGVQCSGKIKGSSVIMTGAIGLNASLSGFTKATLEISAENENLLSNWKFSETIKEPETEVSRDRKQAGFAFFTK